MAPARAVSLALCFAYGARVAGADLAEPPAWADAAEEDDCSSGLHLLQRKGSASATSAETALAHSNSEGSNTCEGPWCPMLLKFTKLFDSNNPWKMQKGFDKYSEYAHWNEGIKLAVTMDHFYELYHTHVAQKLSEFLPQRLFEWKFGGNFQTVQPSSATEATVTRNGTITFNLGWWRRNLFWNNVVKSLPNGENFPYSHVTEFTDCKKCPAKMLFKLKMGGLDGTEKGWKVVGVSLIKLA